MGDHNDIEAGVIHSLAQRASIEPLSADLLKQSACDLEISIDDFLDACALAVARNYLGGKYSWEFSDHVMNDLYATVYGPADLGLPKLAWDVYLAFDEGEYVHAESSDMDGEPRTKALLLEIDNIKEGRS